jgi:hemoglobin
MASVYEQIGGARAVEAAVERLYEKILADPDIRGSYAQTDMGRLKAHQRAFLTAALGGPDTYSGLTIRQAHAGRGVTEAAFDGVVARLVATLEELAVPADVIPRIVAALAPLKSDIVGAQPGRAA